ncbi:MAG: hypothetical protein KGZ51_03940 [Erysipelothrix sp.]|jgi:hypothetical protein|nr:hypothetical protein [Erysipelothrix sp.]
MKTKVAYVVMGVYSILLIVGIIFQNGALLNISTALAVVSAIAIQQNESRKEPDEREKFIVDRASTLSYLSLMTVILFGYIGNDILSFDQYLSLELIFQVLIGIGFMTFLSMYVYLSEKY